MLEKVIRDNPSLELAWITNEKGIQVTDFALAHASSVGMVEGGPGTDWSQREWYVEPMRTGETYISNIYYSDAIDDYCLTVSSPIRDREGGIVGLLAVDVRHGGDAGQMDMAA